MDFDDYLKNNNICLKICDLPTNIKGLAYYYSGKYLIAINSRCCDIQQHETFIHELIHILNNHLLYPKGEAKECEMKTKKILNEFRKEFLFDGIKI